MSISIQSIVEADRAIRPYVRRTPVMEVNPKDFGVDWGGRLTLKLEGFQHAGSFKPRGAFTTLLTRGRETRDLVAVSGGNHGAAVGYAAQALGLNATIFVPNFAPTAKVDKIKSYGAEVRLVGDKIADTMEAYSAFCQENDVADVHPYEAVGTITGQGTLGLEWADQCPDMDAVLIAIGGGGLISGVAYAMQMGPAVIGVEPKDARCAFEARKAGAPVEMIPTSIARDSLGAPSIGQMNMEAINSHVDDIALVEDDAIREAQAALWRTCGVAAELGASASLAAVMSGAVTPEPGSHVGVLVCGSNVDLATI